MKYAITTFGPAPRKRVFNDIDSAIRAAERLPNTTTARIYECDSDKLARSADISRLREGERIVWTNR